MIKNIGKQHLTATDKKHIEALFKSGHTSAKINNSLWCIVKGDPTAREYTIRKQFKGRGLGFIGEPLRMMETEYQIIHAP